jgi:hypothetical protein
MYNHNDLKTLVGCHTKYCDENIIDITFFGGCMCVQTRTYYLRFYYDGVLRIAYRGIEVFCGIYNLDFKFNNSAVVKTVESTKLKI